MYKSDQIHVFWPIAFLLPSSCIIFQSVESKNDRRLSNEEWRKQKRQMIVCRLRWSQEFWYDIDEPSLVIDENHMPADKFVIPQQQLLQNAHARLMTLEASTISINTIIEDILPIAINLVQQNFPMPLPVLKMINRIALHGNQMHLELIFETGIINMLIDGLYIANGTVLYSTVDVLYNIAAAGMKYWQKYIPGVGVPALLTWLSTSDDYENMQIIVRLLGEICIGASIPMAMFVKLLKLLQKFMRDYNADMTQECLSVLQKISASGAPLQTERIDRIVSFGILDSCMHLIRYSCEEIVEESLQVVVNISTIHIYNKVFVESGLLSDIKSMFYSSNRRIQKNLMSLLLNVVSDQNSIQAIVDAEIMTAAMAQFEGRFSVQKLMVQIIRDFVENANEDQIKYLMERTDAVLALGEILRTTDVNIIYVSILPK